MTEGPLDLIEWAAAMLDDPGIPYAFGGGILDRRQIERREFATVPD